MRRLRRLSSVVGMGAAGDAPARAGGACTRNRVPGPIPADGLDARAGVRGER